MQVFAPAIRFNTPAVDASEIKYEIRKDSAFRSSAAALEGLKQSITILAKDRAARTSVSSGRRDAGRPQNLSKMADE